MAANSRFAIAVHTLGVLAFVGDKPVSSGLIAKSVGTNPVVIRRIMRKLVKHGLVEVRMGTGGGSRLTKPPSEISLAAIYESLEEEDVFEVPALGEDHCCPIGRSVRPVLEEVLAAAQNEMRAYLGKISLENVMDSVNAAIVVGKSR
ncbi:MAG: Rrf2 family transcriptional regulator [Acidobacteriota bacterium]|nr:Rrf2 family transcriptional regulator [Acidobacteriota bacterium]MDH3530103.1 Rrf2 family transcriptional regulator [Acidobacteriota bacterium]